MTENQVNIITNEINTADESEMIKQADGKDKSEGKNEKCKWYAVQVYSSFENSIMKNIKDMIIVDKLEKYFENFYCPAKEVDESAKKTKQRMFYPGYILIKMEMNERTWSFINKINKVVGFLGSNRSKPTPLSEKQYLEMVENVKEKIKEKTVEIDNISIGQLVIIKEGSFKSLKGSVESIDSDRKRLKVLVKIFDRETAIDLDWNQVELVK